MLFQCYHFVFTPQQSYYLLNSNTIFQHDMGQSKLQQLNSLVKEDILINWREFLFLFLPLSEWCCFWAKHTKYFWTIDPLFSHIAPHLRGAMTSIDIWGDHYCNVHVCACFVSCVFFWPLVSIFHCYIIFYKADNWKSIPSLHYKSM